MPQMAPINWLMLFFMFISIYLMFCMLNYYHYNLNYPSKNNQYKKNSQSKFLNWKW